MIPPVWVRVRAQIRVCMGKRVIRLEIMSRKELIRLTGCLEGD
jgi:hypothetical protein